MAALNASMIAHCKNDGKSEILHFLFENQKKWAKGDEIKDVNSNLNKILDFPQPFGPTIPVSPSSIRKSVFSANDLKPLS